MDYSALRIVKPLHTMSNTVAIIEDRTEVLTTHNT